MTKSPSNDDLNISFLLEIYDRFIEKNDFQNALSVARKLITIRGQAQDWLIQGTCQTLLGYFEEAMESFAKTINIDPENSVAWSNLGGLLNSIGDDEKALMCFYQAIELEPNNIDVLTNIGTSLSNLGKHEKALEILDNIIQQDTNFVVAWTNRGLALGNLKRYEEALFSFNQALLLEPNDEVALVSRGLVLLCLEHYEEALAAYDLVLQFNPNDADSWLGRGTALANTFHYEEGLKSIEKSIELDEHNSKAWFVRGILFSELECYTKALNSFNQSIELGNRDFAVLINRAKALLALNNWQEGAEALDTALNSLSDIEYFDERKITSKIVCNLLNQTNDRATWQSQIQTLIEIYDKHLLSHLLRKGLIESVSRLVSSIFRVKKVRAWRDIWQEQTGNRPEFQTPLRLLNTAVDYREMGASPFLYLELSKEEENLFKTLLGVEEIPNQLNESELIVNAANVALTGYKLLGRGVVCFFGEKPEYITCREDMPDELLALVDEYAPEQEFLVIPSNHQSVMDILFAEIEMDLTKSVSDEEYRQELEKVLIQLEQQGLNIETINRLRQITLAYRNMNINVKGYSPETLAIVQKCLEEAFNGNLKPLIDFCNLFQ